MTRCGPAMRGLCNALAAATKLRFTFPAADYVDVKILHFKSTGTGYALIESLAGAFSCGNFFAKILRRNNGAKPRRRWVFCISHYLQSVQWSAGICQSNPGG
ncbi:hypothetical protein ES150_13395 [Enterobacillus tribolii]|nr:hypothetical protein [Enterobacillus tribolii]